MKLEKMSSMGKNVGQIEKSVVANPAVVLMIGLIATGLDNLSAFTATAAMLNNLGPGLGSVASNYAGVTDAGKWILVVGMVFGRLEVFSLLVLFSPTFWRS